MRHFVTVTQRGDRNQVFVNFAEVEAMVDLTIAGTLLYMKSGREIHTAENVDEIALILGVDIQNDHCTECDAEMAPGAGAPARVPGGDGTERICDTCIELQKEYPACCECDSTHQQNDTVCRWCWAHGRRHWNDPEVAA